MKKQIKKVIAVVLGLATVMLIGAPAYAAEEETKSENFFSDIESGMSDIISGENGLSLENIFKTAPEEVSEAPSEESPETPTEEAPETPKEENPETPTEENPETPNEENPETPSEEDEFEDDFYEEHESSYSERMGFIAFCGASLLKEGLFYVALSPVLLLAALNPLSIALVIPAVAFPLALPAGLLISLEGLINVVGSPIIAVFTDEPIFLL